MIIYGLQTDREGYKICHSSLLSVIARNVFGLLICVVNEHLCVDEIQNFQKEGINKQSREECKLKRNSETTRIYLFSVQEKRGNKARVKKKYNKQVSVPQTHKN